jgi:hypothetical protein
MAQPMLRRTHYSVQSLVSAALAGFVLVGVADSLVLAGSRGALTFPTLTFHSVGHRAKQPLPKPQADEDYIDAFRAATK